MTENQNLPEINNTKLTDEQIEDIAAQLDEVVKGTDVENIINFPSNQGQETTNLEDRENGEYKQMLVSVDPNTGENKIIGSADELDGESFEEMFERIKNTDMQFEQTPITEKDIIQYIAESDKDSSLIKEISKDNELDPETIKDLLQIVNRKMNKEEFNIYKAFPEEVKRMIDKYLESLQVPVNSTQGKTFRNYISEQLINEFITNISINKTMNDFNKELEDLFNKGSNELAESIVGYTEERNKKYREYADQIEDADKKDKINNILDQIDEAYNLIGLKEFALRCKIKKFELEKPQKLYNSFLYKYSDSVYNIYDINMAEPILYRNINSDNEEVYSADDIHAFFICFCKYCNNMSPNNVTEHAFMYYVIYNIVLMDMNKGESREVSDKFLDNIKEVIMNLRQRNNNFA